MRDLFEDYKKVIVYTVMVLLAFVTVLILYGVVLSLIDILTTSDGVNPDKHDMLQFIGNFLLIIVCLELIDTLAIYIRKHEIQVEAVMMVALTAVARELIVFDYEAMDASILIGIGLVIAAIASAYYLIKKMHWDIFNNEPEKV